MIELLSRVRKVFALLKRTRPIADPGDVAWWGPYFMARRGEWCPSHFVLYRGTLYARLSIPPGSHALSWEVGSDAVKLEKDLGCGGSYHDEDLWGEGLNQIERRLKSALKDFSRYNRFVEKHLPLACRTGKVRRELTWPGKSKRPVSLRQARLLESALNESKQLPPLRQMTRSQYLKTAAIAYDAGFKELRSLSPLQKYKKKADTRHGGLLNLADNDAYAFDQWFCSDAWSGCHPWEIVFGHPHGVMFSPRYNKENHRWSYCLWVDSLGWYVTAARMAAALAGHKIPFEFLNQDVFLDALRGRDEVDVGPDLYAVKYGELKKQRPEALAQIRWDPIPQLSPVTKDESARIKKAEQTI